MEAASLQCQLHEQPENNSVVQPAGMSGVDVVDNLITEQGLTTSPVAVSESTPPVENGAHEVLVKPMIETEAPKGEKVEQEASKGAQEQETGQAVDNIPGPEDGEGLACANGGRQRRASALAATRKVSDYIVQESKSIRELRNDLQAEAGQGGKKQGKKRKAVSPTTPLAPPCVSKTSPSSSAAEACTQQLWEGSSDGEAGPLPREAAAAAPQQASIAEHPTENGCTEHPVDPPAEPAAVPLQQPAAEPVNGLEGSHAPLEKESQDAAPTPAADAVPLSENADMAGVCGDGSTEAGDGQPAAPAPEAAADEPAQGMGGAAAAEELPQADASTPAVEVPHGGDGAGEEADEEDKEWPPKGSLAAEAALLPGRTQYVRKSALEARTKIAGPRLKRKYTRRKQPGAAGEAGSEGDGDSGDGAAAEGEQQDPAEGVTPPNAAGEGAEKATFFPSGKRRGRPPGSRNLRPRGRGRGRGRWGAGARRGRTQDTPSDDDGEMVRDANLPAMSPTASYYKDQEMDMDTLHGCTKCRFNQTGCGACRDAPIMERPKSVRWKPDAARPQTSVPSAPTFYPTAEEFTDPVAYINKIRPEGEKAGIACIVPPEGWEPPFALEKGTNGQSAESFRFSIRKQLTSHLCMRVANTGKATKRAPSRYDRAGEDEDPAHEHADFGFVTLERPYTLRSFAAYADWVKALHFSNPPPKAFSEPIPTKRRKLCSYSGPEPTVEEIEAEFWRIVESPDEVVESLYGQDLDSGHHGSGFPLPPFRQRLLEAHLAATEGAKKDGEKRKFTPEETVYSEHKWNINNMPRCKGSVLRYLVGEELITGVMVPWLYVGSCLSAFCWHVEDHALYSVNYLHMGAPKVWYGVPAHASEALEIAMRDALPHLFEHSPDLLYQLVTLVSPTQLRARGVPVHRLVHKEGSFVITFPNAYHAGFNTGFNCAEAVNFGPPDWLPWGTYVADKYRREGRSATLSHDALLIALVAAAPDVSARLMREAQAAEAEKVSVVLIPDEDAVAVKVELRVPSVEPAAAKTEDADVKMEDAAEPSEDDRACSQQDATTSGRDYVPGESTDLSFLDPINRADTPPRAIQLAAAELSLRLEQNRQRLTAGLADAVDTIERRRMCGKAGALDADGVHTNTEDVDCEVCKGDLHLWAVVSPKCPGRATCAEHASALGCPVDDMVLLYRFTLEELEAFLEDAKRCIPGAEEAIAQALEHKAHQKHEPEVVKLGPISMGERLRIGADFDSDEEADVATPAPTPPPQQPKRQYKRKTADTSEGVMKPKRKYTRKSDKWKTKKVKFLMSEDEDEMMPDAEGADGDAGAEAPAGDGVRRTRRPRAATRNISELLADAEDSFGEEEEPEPEPDSEQETRRTKQRWGLPTKRGGRRRSEAAEEEAEEPLPIIEHELDAQPAIHEVSRMSVPSVPVPVWPPVVPPPVVSPVAPTPAPVITTGAPSLPPAAQPVAAAQQMIPIAMLAELQRVMAHNAAMAASASTPPGSLPFNPYELLAHAANDHQNGAQGMLPLMQTLARLLPMAAYQASQTPPAQQPHPTPAMHSYPAAPQASLPPPPPAQPAAHPAYPGGMSAPYPHFSAPFPGMQNAPGWPPGFGGSHPTYPTPASVAAQQMAWQQQQPPQPPALAPQQPAWQPAVFPPQQQATQPELKETLAQAPGLHFAMQSPAQSAPQPEQPMAQVGQSAAGAEQTAPPLNAVMSEAAQAHNNWPAGFQQVAPPPQMEPLEAAEFTAMINEASSHIG